MGFSLVIGEATRLQAKAGKVGSAAQMNEETFRAFYERTAGPVWAYLSRITGDPQIAEDLLQETYYRFVRANAEYEDESHRRNSLFRIATNLARDYARRLRRQPTQPLPEADGLDLIARQEGNADQLRRRADLFRAMQHLKPQQRAMLWLAYAQGASHREIAEILGVRVASVKNLLLRARRKLAKLMRGAHGLEPRP